MDMAVASRVFELEDNVPIPEGPPPESRTIYPLTTMQPGQSFFVAATEQVSAKVLQNRLKAAVHAAQRRQPGTTYTWRITNEVLRGMPEGSPPAPGVRVWRLT